jgi:hypothetical protein
MFLALMMAAVGISEASVNFPSRLSSSLLSHSLLQDVVSEVPLPPSWGQEKAPLRRLSSFPEDCHLYSCHTAFSRMSLLLKTFVNKVWRHRYTIISNNFVTRRFVCWFFYFACVVRH